MGNDPLLPEFPLFSDFSAAFVLGAVESGFFELAETLDLLIVLFAPREAVSLLSSGDSESTFGLSAAPSLDF